MAYLITRWDDRNGKRDPVAIVRDRAAAERMAAEGDATGARNKPLWDAYIKEVIRAKGGRFSRAEPAWDVPRPNLAKVPWDELAPLDGDLYQVEEVPEWPLLGATPNDTAASG